MELYESGSFISHVQRLILKPEQMKKLSAAMKKQKGFRLQFDGPQIEQHIGAGLFTTVRRKTGLSKTLAIEHLTVGGKSSPRS